MKIWLFIVAILGIAAAALRSQRRSRRGWQSEITCGSIMLTSCRGTSSPLAAAVADSPQLVQVREDENHLLLVTIFNFHEGGAEFVLHSDGSVAVNLPAGFEVSNCHH